MKKAVVFVFLLFSLPVSAQITIKNESAEPFNFSDALLAAAKDCLPYSEDFTQANPRLKALGALFGNVPFSIQITVKGKDEAGFCAFSVVNGLFGSTVCRVSPEQRQEIYQAMLDRSTTPVTESFTTYSFLETPDGKKEKIPMQITMTDNKFNIVWNKINNTACEILEPTKQDEEKLKEQLLSFPPEFIEKIRSCLPGSLEKNFLFLSTEITVRGKENGRCVLSFPPFELLLTDEQLDGIGGLEDLYDLAEDDTAARYVPEYQADGLLYALNACARNEKEYKGPVKTQTIKNIKIQTGVQSVFSGGGCQIKLANVIEKNNQKKGFGKICHIPQNELSGLLSPHQAELSGAPTVAAAANGEISSSFSYNEKTANADRELLQKLFAHGWCR